MKAYKCFQLLVQIEELQNHFKISANLFTIPPSLTTAFKMILEGYCKNEFYSFALKRLVVCVCTFEHKETVLLRHFSTYHKICLD